MGSKAAMIPHAAVKKHSESLAQEQKQAPRAILSIRLTEHAADGMLYYANTVAPVIRAVDEKQKCNSLHIYAVKTIQS